MKTKTDNYKKMEIRELIKRRRLELGITQKRLAELTGFSQPTVSYMENGKQGISQAQLVTICRVLDIKMTLNYEY